MTAAGFAAVGVGTPAGSLPARLPPLIWMPFVPLPETTLRAAGLSAQTYQGALRGAAAGGLCWVAASLGEDCAGGAASCAAARALLARRAQVSESLAIMNTASWLNG